MKAQIEKRKIRLEKELEIIQHKLIGIDKQITGLNASAQTLINTKIAKQGAVGEYKELLAGMNKDDKGTALKDKKPKG